MFSVVLVTNIFKLKESDLHISRFVCKCRAVTTCEVIKNQIWSVIVIFVMKNSPSEWKTFVLLMLT
jgi:hypothetical protein